ncbi:MAG: hypothetical protein KJ767_03940 [Nanoarchaeota archaeon]|nr:hypothetical protein [Nanoarchaeota archaeon]
MKKQVSMMKQIGKFWNWLWNSNSLLSWLVSLLLAFVLVRFIFYPLLGLIFATSLPLVVVESGSMEHPGGFDTWWQTQESYYGDFGITGQAIQGWPFKVGLNKGDIMVIQGKDFEQLKVGDVVVFKPEFQNKAIIHRIVKVEDDYIETKGDANIGQISFEEKIKPEQIQGIAIARLPYLGWIKLFFVEAFTGVR